MKVFYLVLVYLMPFSLLALPEEDLYQRLWLWFYAPFALAVVLLLSRLPLRKAMPFVVLTPLFFLAVMVISLFFVGVKEGSGMLVGFQASGLTLAIGVPVAILVGPFFVLAALLLYSGFRHFGLINEEKANQTVDTDAREDVARRSP